MTTARYPGVSVEQTSSGVPTISPVATSIGAFVGWAAQGPTDGATRVQSWSDYQRAFGGLDSRSNLGYAVSQFFANGGQQTYIVRLVADGSNATTAAAVANTLLKDASEANFLSLHASSAGAWGNHYGVVAQVSSLDATRFCLSVGWVADMAQPTQYSIVESFESLSLDPNDSRYVVNVINADSNYLRFATADIPPAFALPSRVPTFVATLTLLTNGGDGSVLKPAALYPADPLPPTAGEMATFRSVLAAGGGSGGVNMLTRVPLFNLLCVPGLSDPPTIALLQQFCVDERAFMIVDSDQAATVGSLSAPDGLSGIVGAPAINSAFYFPWVDAPDPLNENRDRPFPPCGFVAGLYASTDSWRGVWKAPAGEGAGLSGSSGLIVVLTDPESGSLNALGINCLRRFSTFGTVVWGARTLRGTDQAAADYKYVPVRRFALFLEASVQEGTQWVVFEPNAAPLWAQIRLSVGAFMQTLFAQGAFAGASAREAYFVQCDAETTTPNDIDQGIVNILVGFAPLQPAEFVIIQIQQMAGQVQTEESLVAQFSVNPSRFDPYKNFRFQLKWDGRYVAGFSKVGALQRATEVVDHREGGDPSTGRKSPGRSKYEAITLERGVTHDPEFEQWASKVCNVAGGPGEEVSLQDLRKDITLEVYDEAGELAVAYQVFGCWVCEFQALPDMDANVNALAIEHMKLENEGWERDDDAVLPRQPSGTEPPRS